MKKVRLSVGQRRVLRGLASGQSLKAQRDLDGRKLYELRSLDGATLAVRPSTVQALVGRGLIDSNKKFPAATFWLTTLGREAIASVATG